MPNYGVPQAGGVLTSLQPGDGIFYLFDNESPTEGQASVAFCRSFSPGGDDAGSTFVIDWASAPTGVVTIEASNQDVDADYQTIWTWSANNQHDNYTDIVRFKFYRAKVVSVDAGLPVTVTVQR